MICLMPRPSAAGCSTLASPAEPIPARHRRWSASASVLTAMVCLLVATVVASAATPARRRLPGWDQARMVRSFEASAYDRETGRWGQQTGVGSGPCSPSRIRPGWCGGRGGGGEPYAREAGDLNPVLEWVTVRLARTEAVRMALYDVLGRAVAVLADDVHTVPVEATTLPSVVYTPPLERGLLCSRSIPRRRPMKPQSSFDPNVPPISRLLTMAKERRALSAKSAAFRAGLRLAILLAFVFLAPLRVEGQVPGRSPRGTGAPVLTVEQLIRAHDPWARMELSETQQSRPSLAAPAETDASVAFDPTFGGNGKVEVHFAYTDVHGNEFKSQSGMALAQDGAGRTVVAGQIGLGSGLSYPAVLRLNPDGGLDPTFNGDGRLVLSSIPIRSYFASVSIDANGRIVLSGTAGYPTDASYSGVYNNNFLVVRLNPDGTLDRSFSGDGRASIEMGGQSDSGLRSAIDGEGRITVVRLVAATHARPSA